MGDATFSRGCRRWLVAWAIGLLMSGNAMAAGIDIVSATYGPNCPVTRDNARQPLATACNGRNQCTYIIDVDVLHDPAVGCAKTFEAEWRCDGGAVQRQLVAAEANKKPLTIRCQNVSAIAAAAAPRVTAPDRPQIAAAAATRAGAATPAPATADAGIRAASALEKFKVAAASRQLDSAAIDRGAVRAWVNGASQKVTPNELSTLVDQGATFITRLPGPHVAMAVSPAVIAVVPNVKIRQAVELPYEISGLTKDTHTPITVRARIAEGTGLVFDQVAERFVDRVYVYLVATTGSARVQLENPVAVMVRAVGASVDPLPVSLATTEDPTTVTIAVVNPGGSVFPVTVSAGSDDEGDTLDLAVVKPRVSLASAGNNIVGWGIGTTTIYVRAPELGDGATVDLAATAGGLSPGTVTLDMQGHGTATLRSDSGAEARVSVAGSGSAGDEITVRFRSPFPFLLSAALGGLAGAFLRGRGRRSWGKALSIGIVTAIAATAAYAVGVTTWVLELTHAEQLASSGEAVVFVVGFLAALAGVKVFLPGK